jgi:hypothetical protein
VNDKVTAPDPRAELPLKLEVGKEYVTRERGEAVRILRVDRDGYHVGAFWSGIESFWLRDGRYYLPNDALDLIAEARPQVPTPSSAVAWRVPGECTERLAKARAALANAAVNYRDPCNLTQARAIDKASEELEAAAIENRAFTTPVPDEAVRRLVEAGKALSFAAQITGGTAGRDDGLVAAIDCFSAALAHPALRAFIGSEK